MNKVKLNYFIDVLMAVIFIITAVTGLIIFLFLPSGIRQGNYQTFLGILKGNWIFIHDWSGIILIVLVVLHFILHWNWMIHITKSIFKKK